MHTDVIFRPACCSCILACVSFLDSGRIRLCAIRSSSTSDSHSSTIPDHDNSSSIPTSSPIHPRAQGPGVPETGVTRLLAAGSVDQRTSNDLVNIEVVLGTPLQTVAIQSTFHPPHPTVHLTQFPDMIIQDRAISLGL